jgi:hypothetical protein
VDIDLHINGVGFTLGERFDTQKLNLARCKKLGFLSRFQIKAKGTETVYWAKNCDITCFASDFRFCANLDTSSGPDLMVGTSAYLYFTKPGLEKVLFQVLENEFAAIAATDDFQRLCERKFGRPTSQSPTRWLDAQHVVSCALNPTKNRALFQWLTRR